MLEVYADIFATALHQSRAGGSGSGSNFRRLILSSGDLDPVVALHGTERAVQALMLPLAEGGDRRPWCVCHIASFFIAHGIALKRNLQRIFCIFFRSSIMIGPPSLCSAYEWLSDL